MRSLAHTLRLSKLDLTRRFLALPGVRALLTRLDPSSVDSGVAGGRIELIRAADPVVDGTVGLDYSTDSDPYDEPAFNTMPERLEHIDTYLGARVVSAFYGTAADGGHTHGGTGWDGQPLPADSVTAPEGALGGCLTAADHLLSTELHPGRSGESAVPVFYDDFEADDLTTRWSVAAGAPASEEGPLGACLLLPDGAALAPTAPAGAWRDRFTLEFDLQAGTGTLRIAAGAGGTGSYPEWCLSAAEACAVLEQPAGEHLESAACTLPATTDWVHVRLSVYGGRLSAWLDIDRISTDGAFHAGVPLHMTGQLSAPGGSGGQLLFSASGGELRLRAVHVARARREDARELTDIDGRFGAEAGLPGATHAATHASGGSDPLDISGLADRYRLLVPPADRAHLFSGGPGANPHTHSDMAAILAGAVGGDRLLYDHVRNPGIHGGGAGHGRHRILPGHISGNADSSAGSPYPYGADDAYGSFFYDYGAYRDHGHHPPCWYLERRIRYYPAPDPYYAALDRRYPTLVSSVYPELFVEEGDPDHPAVTLRELVPTLAGEYGYPSGEPTAPYLAAQGALVPGNTVISEEYHRARLPLWCAGPGERLVTLHIPAIDRAMWITVRNGVDGLLPFPGIWSSGATLYPQRVKLLLREGWNDLLVYALKPWGYSLATVVLPIWGEMLEGDGVVSPVPLFSHPYWSGPEPAECSGGVGWRSLALQGTEDPAFLAPELYLPGAEWAPPVPAEYGEGVTPGPYTVL